MENLLEKLVAEGIVQKGIYSSAFTIGAPGTYLVVKDHKYGVIGNDGKVLIGCRYECISQQNDGTYQGIRRAGKYFATDTFDSKFNYV